jgi:hypothetical protein
VLKKSSDQLIADEAEVVASASENPAKIGLGLLMQDQGAASPQV